MDRRVLILRPQPGADETAARARAIGLEPIVAPLFTVRPVAWDAPDPADYDAVMLTSANAARQGGAGLAALFDLPCYAVGGATATAARQAGFRDVRAGMSDARELLHAMAGAGVSRALHLCGADRIEADAEGIAIERTVYASEAADALPALARSAAAGGALILLHSPRAAALFAALADCAGLDRAALNLAAISANAAAAAGPGWAVVHHAATPSDQALLELAAKLCNIGGQPGQRLDE